MTGSLEDDRLARGALEMEAEGAAPGGAVIANGGRRFGFSGWAELAAAIEDWRATERPHTHDDGRGDQESKPEVPTVRG